MEQVFGERENITYDVRCTMSDVRRTVQYFEMKSYELRGNETRLKHFTANVAKLTLQLPDNLVNRIYKGQIVRSSSSAAAN